MPRTPLAPDINTVVRLQGSATGLVVSSPVGFFLHECPGNASQPHFGSANYRVSNYQYPYTKAYGYSFCDTQGYSVSYMDSSIMNNCTLEFWFQPVFAQTAECGAMLGHYGQNNHGMNKDTRNDYNAPYVFVGQLYDSVALTHKFGVRVRTSDTTTQDYYWPTTNYMPLHWTYMALTIQNAQTLVLYVRHPYTLNTQTSATFVLSSPLTPIAPDGLTFSATGVETGTATETGYVFVNDARLSDIVRSPDYIDAATDGNPGGLRVCTLNAVDEYYVRRPEFDSI